MKRQPLKNNRLIRHAYYFSKGITKRKALKASAEQTLCAFGRSFPSKREKDLFIKDMVYMYTHYGFSFDEFLYFRFEDLPLKERLNFVADWEHLGYACCMNSMENDSIFDNKHKTYQTFKPFYRRSLLLFESEEQFPEFEEFVKAHSKFIIKPLDLSCGRGIQIIDSTEPPCLKTFFLELLKEQKRFVVEELIVQAAEMAKLHPASVNTVRVPTIRLDEETLVVNPFLRVGQNGNHVDNAGAGGIICAVDAETGKTFGTADENGNRFTTHPQTGEELIGFQIPRWEEAKALVKQMAAVVPTNRYTGWDIALTENGWVLVEANRRGQFVWQIASKKGFRPEIEKILKKMGRRY